MSLFDKVGREIIKFFIDSEKTRAGEKVIFVIDQETKELQEKILNELKKMNRHLSEITDLEGE